MGKKKENKVLPPQSPICYILKKKGLENLVSSGKSVRWRLPRVGPTFSFRLTNVYSAFSPLPALGGPLKSCSPPPAQSDLPPTAAAHIQLFSFPVERAVIESGGLFFLASPRGSQPAGRCRKDIASSRAPPGPKPRQLLSAALVSAPREPGLRSTRQGPGSEAGG